MNDWIIWGVFVLIISEIVFVILRINFNNEYWIIHKFMAIVCGVFIGLLHLLILVENSLIGEPIIFHWERLIYEFYIICAVVIFFIMNYFLTKFIGKFASGEEDE